MSKGSRLVADAILGNDTKNVSINGKVYSVPPPTIYRLAGAGQYLSDFGDEKSISDIFRSVNNSMNLCNALSWLIKGDESISVELSQGTFEDIVEALETAYSLISVKNFTKLSTLAKNVAELIAKSN